MGVYIHLNPVITKQRIMSKSASRKGVNHTVMNMSDENVGISSEVRQEKRRSTRLSQGLRIQLYKGKSEVSRPASWQTLHWPKQNEFMYDVSMTVRSS